MKLNVSFNNVRFYDATKFDIKIGETCKVEIVDHPNVMKWFSDNDPVLSISVDGKLATITALAIGKCDIQLQEDTGALQKTLLIEVFDDVAVSLNPTAGNPELKA